MKNTTEEWGYIDAQLINSQPISADAESYNRSYSVRIRVITQILTN